VDLSNLKIDVTSVKSSHNNLATSVTDVERDITNMKNIYAKKSELDIKVTDLST